ncbi:MAG: AI-2E family transporter [Bacteroidetes bacterium]|nr:AI-2E family transporter [Bacteroidota bacterium]
MNSFVFKTAAVFFVFFACVASVYFLSSLLVPLFLAFLLAVLLQPVVSFLQAKVCFSHTWAVVTALLFFLLMGSGILVFIGSEIAAFSADFPKIQENVTAHIYNIQDWIFERFNIGYSKQKSYLLHFSLQSIDMGKAFMSSTLSHFSSILMMLVFVPIYMFLILSYRGLFLEFLNRLVKPQHHVVLKSIVSQIKTVVHSYLVGLLIEMLIIALLVSISLMVMGVRYAVFVGVLTAFLNLIPYVGIFLSALFAMLIALSGSTDLSILLSIAILFMVVHLIDSNILIPKVVSSKVKINALFSMLGIICGGMLIGISGMFLALPAIAITKVIFDRIPSLQPWGYLLGDDIPVYLRKKKQQNNSVSKPE